LPSKPSDGSVLVVSESFILNSNCVLLADAGGGCFGRKLVVGAFCDD
jgi:hypothetical protein